MDPATQSKLLTLLQSRKFWSLVVALVSLGVAYQTGQMPLPQVELGVVGALSGYAIATGIEDNGQAQARATPPQTTVNVTAPPTVTSGPTTATGGPYPLASSNFVPGGKP